MDDQLLLGVWRGVLPIPPQIWKRVVKGDFNMDFMSPDHHQVRNLVVEALPREGSPLSPSWIRDELGLPLPKVVEILDELEKNMIFLFRDTQGAVTWAYPVTVDKTPHHLSFSSGEEIFAA